MLALAFLIPEVSFSRDSYSEIPSQMLLFTALWLLVSPRVLPRWRARVHGRTLPRRTRSGAHRRDRLPHRRSRLHRSWRGCVPTEPRPGAPLPSIVAFVARARPGYRARRRRPHAAQRALLQRPRAPDEPVGRSRGRGPRSGAGSWSRSWRRRPCSGPTPTALAVPRHRGRRARRRRGFRRVVATTPPPAPPRAPALGLVGGLQGAEHVTFDPTASTSSAR